MVIGHFAVGFALKKIEPRLSLGALLLGVNLADVLFGVFLLTGLEHARIDPAMAGAYPLDLYDYPITHSLAGALAWSLLGFLTYRFRPLGDRASRMRPALVIAAAIFSHFLCDVISHRKDLTLFGSSLPKIGLGLYNYMGWNFTLEMLMFTAGVALYLRETRRAPSPDYALTSFIAVLLGIYVWTFFDPAMKALGHNIPEVTAIAILLSFGQGIFIVWGHLVDRRRTAPGV